MSAAPVSPKHVLEDELMKIKGLAAVLEALTEGEGDDGAEETLYLAYRLSEHVKDAYHAFTEIIASEGYELRPKTTRVPVVS